MRAFGFHHEITAGCTIIISDKSSLDRLSFLQGSTAFNVKAIVERFKIVVRSSSCTGFKFNLSSVERCLKLPFFDCASAGVPVKLPDLELRFLCNQILRQRASFRDTAQRGTWNISDVTPGIHGGRTWICNKLFPAYL